MASVAVPIPITLTDRRNDITTIKRQPVPSGLVNPDVGRVISAMVQLTVETRNGQREIRLAIPNLPGPNWLTPMLQRIGKLLSLPNRIGSGQTAEVNSTTIQTAVDELHLFMSPQSSLPEWTPTQQSGVQLDWHERGVDLEIAFEPGENSGYAVFSDLEHPRSDWDGPVAEHLDELTLLFRDRLNS